MAQDAVREGLRKRKAYPLVAIPKLFINRQRGPWGKRPSPSIVNNFAADKMSDGDNLLLSASADGGNTCDPVSADTTCPWARAWETVRRTARQGETIGRREKDSRTGSPKRV